MARVVQPPSPGAGVLGAAASAPHVTASNTHFTSGCHDVVAPTVTLAAVPVCGSAAPAPAATASASTAGSCAWHWQFPAATCDAGAAVCADPLQIFVKTLTGKTITLPRTRSTRSSRRSRTRRAFRLISSASSSLGSSSRMVARSLTTTSARRAPCIWCCGCEGAQLR